MTAPWPRWFRKFGPELISVIPHDAESDTIPKPLRGKCPGTRKESGKWVGTAGSLAGRAMTEAEAKTAHRTGAVVGMLGRKFPALDIDIEDEEIAREVANFAETYLGVAPCRGREGSARRLFMFRGEGHRKRRLEFRRPGHKQGDKHDAIELLGDGQYYNVEGVHPSGKPYQWDAHPCDHDLGEISPEGVSMLFEDLPAVLARHGCVIGRESIAGAPGSRKRIGDVGLSAPSPQLVLDLLSSTPCSEQRFKDRNDIVAWLCGVKAALGEDHEEHRGAVLDWFLEYPGAEQEYFDKIWDSIADASVGWHWLAAESGTGITAQTDFADDVGEADAEDMREAYPEAPEDAVVESMLSRFRYARRQNVFVEVTSGEEMSPGQFDTDNVLVSPCGTSGVRAAHNQFLNHPRAAKHASLTYKPGQGVICDGLLNTWRAPALAPIQGDATLWLNHVAELLPDPAQRDHFLDWCAFVLQRPGVKINHAIVLLTEAHGAGKDTALAPLTAMLDRNYKIVMPAELCGTFTGFLEKQVILVPEMKNYTKGEVYNSLKAWIARPPENVSVRKMRMDAYDIPNVQNWIFTTNSGDAVGLEQSDRRFWVGDCVGHPREDRAYYCRLWNWLNGELSQGVPDPDLPPDYGKAIAAAWLLKRDLCKFDPGDAPMTAAKQDMIDLATPAPVRWLNEQFEVEGMLYGRAILATAEIRALADDGWQAQPLRDAQISTVLLARGFKKLPGKHRIDGKPRNVWTTLAKPELLIKGDVSVAARLAQDQKKKGAA